MIGSGTTAGLHAFHGLYSLHTLSTGRLVAFFYASGVLTCATSSDGVTWTPAAMTGSLSSSAVVAIAITSDVLYVVTGAPSSPYAILKYTYNTTTNAWTGPTVTNLWTTPTNISSYIGPDFEFGTDAAYHATTRSIGGPGASESSVDGAGAGASAPLNAVFWNFHGGNVLATSPLKYWSGQSGIWVAGYDANTGYITMVPINGNFGNPQSAELVVATSGQFEMYEELTGEIGFIYLSGGSLYSIKRIGIRSYAPPIRIASSVVGEFHLARNASTGDLMAVYANNANDPAHSDLFIAVRKGSWGQPSRIAGLDSISHAHPIGAKAPVAGLLSIAYTDNGTTVQYASVPVGGAPQAPTLLGPIGTTTSLVPSMRSHYNNATLGDPETAGQIQVVRVSDGVTMWDSGQSALGDTPIYGSVGTATALAYDISYQWRRRDWDTTAGAAGPWSAYATFIVRQGGTVTITSLTNEGVVDASSPTTLGTPALSALVSWAQASSHDASAWQFNLYDADDATLLETVGALFGPALTSGTSATLLYPHPPMANAHTYYLSVSFTDASTGVVTESAHWQLITAWVPPPAPTALTFTSDTENGTGRLSWGNDPSVDKIKVEMQQLSTSGAAGPWLQQYFDTVIDHIGLDEQAAGRNYNFRVTAYANGLPSIPATASGRLLLVGGRLGIWFLSTSDRALRAVVGIPTDFTSSKFDEQEDTTDAVMIGDQKETSAAGIEDSDLATQQWWLPAIFRRGVVTLYGHDTYLMLQQLKNRREPLVYKDTRGRVLYVVLRKFWSQDDLGGNMLVGFEVHETKYVGAPIVDLT